MRAALVASLLCACASAQRVESPVDAAALRPGDGRVAVRVESSGAAQDVAVVPAGTRATQRMSVDAWCRTPCTLHLTPGPHALWTGAPAVMDAVTPVRVGERPMRVRMRAPSRAAWERGRNLVVGGVGFAVVAGIFVGFSPLEVTGGSPTGPETIAVGAGVAALGTALIVYGLRSAASQRTGADEAREDGAP